MIIKEAALEDFDAVFAFVEQLWSYNTYDKNEIFALYQEVLQDNKTFAFLLMDDNSYLGFCHGDYISTFWMSGMTCYISSLIVKPGERGKGYGTAMLNHAKKLAREKGCKALILDSGLSRKKVHSFYEHYGFARSCYGFELILWQGL